MADVGLLTKSDDPSGLWNTYAGCHGTLKARQIDPSASLRLVKFKLYFETKSCIAVTSDRAATPTNAPFGLAAAPALTDGAAALQNGHHGVQNHSTAGLPARLAPLNVAPLSVVPVKLNRSSAAAMGDTETVTNSKAANMLATSSASERVGPVRIMTSNLNANTDVTWIT